MGQMSRRGKEIVVTLREKEHGPAAKLRGTVAFYIG